ncbi:uncharacterized protein LOC128889273 isoform X2 [Hylaeus anthracinus]|uniref:uncharacterized protein LOC128889273 isoform X2 n=1 Tax=Hylaeus anthracinus TaxID=313031 RepID=UPI0023B940C7|nr:uncharacterized protein LOC128889273 isoform X2 [Hylaeus anthracinus]
MVARKLIAVALSLLLSLHAIQQVSATIPIDRLLGDSGISDLGRMISRIFTPSQSTSTSGGFMGPIGKSFLPGGCDAGGMSSFLGLGNPNSKKEESTTKSQGGEEKGQ